jgi:integrase
MAAKLEATSTPGIFRRHRQGCRREGRCDCSYVTVWRHRGRQHTATFRTLAEAREAKGNRDAGDRRPVARIGFEDYFEQWIKSYAGRTARGLTERSRSLYRRSIETYALDRWRTWRLADVEPADVRGLFAAMREDGVSVSSARGIRAALSALFATAVEDGLLRSNPVQGVRLQGAADNDEAEQGNAKALTRAELTLLLAALPLEWRLFFEFLAHTGLRISEAIGLTWRHVDLGTDPRVRVREQCYEGERQRLKSRDARRDIPLSTGMAERLRALRRDSYRGEDSPVFTTDAGTELSRPNLASRVLKPAGESIGLGWVSFHTFRHSCASMLFEHGKNVKQVQEWLGHADPGFTLRTYVHLLDDGLGDADFLDGAVTADPPRVNSGSTGCAETAGNEQTVERAQTPAQRESPNSRKGPQAPALSQG